MESGLAGSPGPSLPRPEAPDDLAVLEPRGGVGDPAQSALRGVDATADLSFRVAI